VREVKTFGTVLLVAAAVSATATAAPQKSYFTFKTPGGVVQCGVFVAGKYSESLLRCDIRTGLKPAVKRPKGCHFDYGSTLELRAKGRAFPGCVSDAIGRIQQTVGYGKTYKKGPFTCTSTRAGLTCRNAAKHGFFLSKKAWRRV
jgi:hypothetical protein